MVAKKIIIFLNKHLLNKLNLILTRPLLNQHTTPLINVYEKLDYCRTMTLSLICNEILEKGLEGNIAELGVFQGKFSRLMSLCLPQKNIYLFDTFKGFDTSFFNTEFEKKIAQKNLNDFNNTSLKEVIKRMPFEDKCIIRSGFFPDSIKQTDYQQEFCLVSLDCDLYEPIYQGLNFFYPRLKKGGYILIHDYNSSLYKDCKTAVDKYCNENMLTIVPISDGWGTAILCK